MSALRYFPYTPRPYQGEVLRKLSKSITKWHVCLHAPTGFGKTPVVLSALMPLIERGYTVLWAVRTGNETDRPIEELKVMVERLGLDVFGISFRGKRDMCPLARKYGELDHSDVTYLCSQRKKNCPYYRNYKRYFDPTPFLDRGPLTYAEVYEVALIEEVCPYFAQRGLAPHADVVSLSYNYVVNPVFEWSLKSLVDLKRTVLVVDEAHNLQRVELGSAEITLGTIRRAMREAEAKRAPEKLFDLLGRVEEKVLELLSGLSDGDDTEYRVSEFIDGSDRDLLEEARKIGERIRRERLDEGKRPHSSLYRFASFWLYALEVEGTRGLAFIAERDGDNLRLCIWDMRAAEILADRWQRFKRCVFMSGTLKPIEAFAETVGLTNYVSIAVPSIYRAENVRVYLVRGLTTRGEALSPEMSEAYVRAVVSLLNRVRASTAVFTASYRIQEELLRAGLAEKARELGYSVFLERRHMRGQESRRVLEGFKSSRGRGLLVAPMGGRFAEGADFPGEELQVIFLAGIPFDKPTTRTMLYLQYYEELYGKERGRLYGYIIPALRRAAQALGRALRSPDDKAVLVLGDERYKRYLPLLPDYVQERVEEIEVSDLSDVDVPWL